MSDAEQVRALHYFGQTDVGVVRKTNEDAFGFFGPGGVFCDVSGFVAEETDLIAVVSDGVGGHDSGEVASASTVASVGCGLGVLAAWARRGDMDAAASHACIADFMKGLNAHLWAFSGQRGQGQRMAATVTAGWFRQDRLSVVHAGDSRLYRWRDSVLECLTVDDTEAGWDLANGKISAKAAKLHPRRHVLQRAVGIEGHLFSVTLHEFATEAGDLYLFCSDGLTDGIDQDALQSGLHGVDLSDLGQLSERLIHAGNQASGKDNITVALVRVLPQSLTGEPQLETSMAEPPAVAAPAPAAPAVPEPLPSAVPATLLERLVAPFKRSIRSGK